MRSEGTRYASLFTSDRTLEYSPTESRYKIDTEILPVYKSRSFAKLLASIEGRTGNKYIQVLLDDIRVRLIRLQTELSNACLGIPSQLTFRLRLGANIYRLELEFRRKRSGKPKVSAVDRAEAIHKEQT